LQGNTAIPERRWARDASTTFEGTTLKGSKRDNSGRRGKQNG
jgi:hypothetical protein